MNTDERWLGSENSVRFDGYYVVVAGERDDFGHRVALRLDPGMVEDLTDYLLERRAEKMEAARGRAEGRR